MPITPGAAGTSFDVLLAFSLDPEANRRVQQGISTMEAEIKRIQASAAGIGDSYKESGEEVKKTSKEVVNQLRAEARAMRAEANAIIDDVKNAQIQTLNTISGAIGSASQKALILGSALTVGIFAEVQRYVNLAPDATAETRAWAAETERLGKARQRVDAVLLREALPLLQQAAKVANQAASFVERNPEIVSAALRGGVVLAGLGAVGMLLSKGIKLYADAQYLLTIPTQLQAANLQSLAGDKMLAAARIQLSAAGGSTPGGGKGGGGLGAFGLVLTGLTLASGIIIGTSKRFDELAKILAEMGPLGRAVASGIQVANHGLYQFKNEILGVGDAARSTGTRGGRSVSTGSGPRMSTETQAAIVEAFSSWKEDDARLIREAAADRLKIIAEGERAIVQITRDAASQRTDINRRFNENRSNIIQRFEEESKRAEEDYQNSRADLVREGQQRLREMEVDHQERLRQILRDGAEAIEEASRERDAVGLFNAQRRVIEETDEENRSFQLERGRARRETEQRIRELDQNYQIERERRRAQFEADLRDNEAQRQEELKRAAAAAQEEINQARAAQAQKLRDLQEGLNAERLRRREVFLSQIRDLDASLLGEKDLRRRYYQEMLIDAKTFFDQYRRTLPTVANMSGSIGGGIATRDSGGYANRGIYGLAVNGIPEFVLSGNTTSAAERAIGSTLTDQSLNRLFSTLGEMRSAVYNDNRRLEAPLSKHTKRMYEESAKEAFRVMLGVR